jgi:hypothetical protein
MPDAADKYPPVPFGPSPALALRAPRAERPTTPRRGKMTFEKTLEDNESSVASLMGTGHIGSIVATGGGGSLTAEAPEHDGPLCQEHVDFVYAGRH